MDTDELYREIILDHYKKPRNKVPLDHIPETMAHENPSCGDSLKLEVTVDGTGKVEKVLFDGRGCAISTASASIMTGLVTGKSVSEARSICGRFIGAMRGEAPPQSLDELSELAAFKGVIQFPIRVKCATLAWHALLVTLPGGDGR